eukprot:1157334-Pelagomonas_calceolata.AAC.21
MQRIVPLLPLSLCGQDLSQRLTHGGGSGGGAAIVATRLTSAEVAKRLRVGQHFAQVLKEALHLGEGKQRRQKFLVKEKPDT